MSDHLTALGRLPSGIYILTVRDGAGTRATGMLASWVQQAGFEPPMLTVAVGVDRYVRSWIKDSGRFVLNQVPAGNKSLLRQFGRGFPPEAEAFEGVAVVEGGPADLPPVLAEALAYMVVDVRAELLSGDHALILGEIVGGGLITGEEPMIHLRKTGANY